MVLSPPITKIGNRKAPVPEHWSFLLFVWTTRYFLPTGIIAYAGNVFKIQWHMSKRMWNALKAS